MSEFAMAQSRSDTIPNPSFSIQTSTEAPPTNDAPKQVGVIGGGQLAWMMTTAAEKLGIELIAQTPHRSDPAVANALQAGYATAAKAIIAPLDDLEATARLAQACQVITFENEFVDLKGLSQLEGHGVCFRPSLSALAPLLDKYEQRTFLQSLGLPVPKFIRMTPESDLDSLGLSFPLVLKSRRHGYDGQGTFILNDAAALTQFWQHCPVDGTDRAEAFMAEEFVPFERELAVMAARSLAGEVVLFPVVETYQQNQVCHWAIAPVNVSPTVHQQIQAIATTLLNQLDAVGIFGIELFLTASGQVLVNEIAPRTHNSGHMTLDACETSQFEQHLRAICGLPLGKTNLRTPGAVMVNLLGFETADHDYLEQRQRLAALPRTFVHWYGKSQAYPGRKLGHVTALLASADREQALQVARTMETIWYGP